jgi:hypothetical protein
MMSNPALQPIIIQNQWRQISGRNKYAFFKPQNVGVRGQQLMVCRC